MGSAKVVLEDAPSTEFDNEVVPDLMDEIDDEVFTVLDVEILAEATDELDFAVVRVDDLIDEEVVLAVVAAIVGQGRLRTANREHTVLTPTIVEGCGVDKGWIIKLLGCSGKIK